MCIEILTTNDDKAYLPQSAVLIDDDELIRSLWQNKAKAKNVALTCYASAESFMENLAHHSRRTFIYIDSDLRGENPGQDWIQHLQQQGFLNVILTTGYPKQKFQGMPWVTHIIDKSPPW